MALSEAGGGAALVVPEYLGAHAHATRGGGTVSHRHDGARPGHGHAVDDPENPTDVALLPVAAAPLTAKGFVLDLEVKEISERPSGTLLLRGYGNTWVRDRDGEKTARGAFDDALGEFMLNPILLDSHNAARPIGFVTVARPDATGLYVEAEVPPPPANSESWHHKVYSDIRNRVRRTFSMGGKFEKAGDIIKRVVLHEISVVSIPANPTSVFAVAEAKGLRFAADEEEGKGRAMQPGVGRGHGRHRTGRAVHTHRNGTRHSHAGGTRVHSHGAHVHQNTHTGQRVAHSHGIAQLGHTHAAPVGMLKEFAVEDCKADTPQDEADEIAARPLGQLFDGLLEALNEIVDDDTQEDDDKVDNIERVLTEFMAEAQERLAADGEDEPDDANPKSWAAALARKHQRADIRKRLASMPAKREQTMDDNATPKPGAKSATHDEGEAVKAMAARLEVLEREQRERELEAKAEQEAQKRLAQEEADRKAAEEAAAADQKRLDDMVAKALERARSSANSGTKMRKIPSLHGPDGGVADDAKGFVGWLSDLKEARRGDAEAFSRMKALHTQAAETLYGEKALGEAGSTSGGFLVPPQYWQAGLAEYRIATAKLRPYVTVLPTNSSLVYIPRETGVSSVAWTGEGGTKPSTDQTFGQVQVPIFTLAGISKVSNQMLQDSNPAVDTIVRKDLGRLIGRAEDQAMIAGSGTGQPTGILFTTGTLAVAQGTATLADTIASLFTTVQSTFFADPTIIVAHPREVNTLRTAKDSQGRYIFEPGYIATASPHGGGPGSFTGAPADSTAPVGTVWGLPVIADANVPTNLAWTGTTFNTTGTESPIIVGRAEEAYLFERQGMTMDVSSEAGTSFEANQTWFRGEERVGFTAARQPTAWAFSTGTTV